MIKLPLELWVNFTQGLTNCLFHRFLDGVDQGSLGRVRTPLPDALQQQRVSGQPVERGHQELRQAEASALFVLLAPLRKQTQQSITSPVQVLRGLGVRDPSRCGSVMAWMTFRTALTHWVSINGI